jgi:hypothetical protein
MRGRRVADPPEQVDDDGLLRPPEEPRWLPWLDEQLAKPVPRWLRWTDRVPGWAVPLVVAALMGGLAAVVVGLGPRLGELLR